MNRLGSRDFARRAAEAVYAASALTGAVYDARKIFKNKILDNTKAMPAKYSRRPKRSTRTLRSYKKKNSSFKGTRTRRTKRSYPRRKTNLRKEVKQIKRQLNADSAKHVYKALYKDTYSCAVNQCSYNTGAIVTGTLLETYMANLRYYDPSVPGTLVTASGATGTYQRELHFKNVHGTIEITNNYQVPCKVKVYLLKPKGDTSIGPGTYYNNSIADQLIGGAGSTTTKGIFPTDLNAFMAQWSVKCVKDVHLDAGARVVATHNTGSFKYDPSLFDSHSLEYQNKFKACAWFIRLEGAFGHDSAVATEQTTLAGQVDVAQMIRAEIHYDAGINLDDLYLNNAQSASFTNSGLVSNKPIADNQALSVA